MTRRKSLLHLHHQFVEIDHLGLEDLFAAESEKLAGERGRLLARLANQLRVLLASVLLDGRVAISSA